MLNSISICLKLFLYLSITPFISKFFHVAAQGGFCLFCTLSDSLCSSLCSTYVSSAYAFGYGVGLGYNSYASPYLFGSLFPYPTAAATTFPNYYTTKASSNSVYDLPNYATYGLRQNPYNGYLFGFYPQNSIESQVTNNLNNQANTNLGEGFNTMSFPSKLSNGPKAIPRTAGTIVNQHKLPSRRKRREFRKFTPVSPQGHDSNGLRLHRRISP